MNWFSVVIAILFIGLLAAILWNYKNASSSEGYGQDASIRASAGWVAGPRYGQDPITHFADQIAEFKVEQEDKLKEMGCYNACKHSAAECDACVWNYKYGAGGDHGGDRESFRFRLGNNPGSAPGIQVSSPAPEVGPVCGSCA